MCKHEPDGGGPEAEARSWAESTNPVAMLFLLGELHPGRHPMLVARLVQRLASAAPSQGRMAATAYVLARRLGPKGVSIEEGKLFHFRSLASRVAGEIARIEGGLLVGAITPMDPDAVRLAYAKAIREFVAHPRILPER